MISACALLHLSKLKLRRQIWVESNLEEEVVVAGSLLSYLLGQTCLHGKQGLSWMESSHVC